MIERDVEIAAPRACAHCPWRLSNQGKRHPHGWYTKANLRRLWGKLRNGERMTCHPTDPTNPVPPGHKQVPDTATTHECTGAIIVVEREYMRFQAICQDLPPGSTDGLRLYKSRHPHGLTRRGLYAILERFLFGGTPLGGKRLPRPDLSDADVGYAPLGLFHPREVRR